MLLLLQCMINSKNNRKKRIQQKENEKGESNEKRTKV